MSTTKIPRPDDRALWQRVVTSQAAARHHDQSAAARKFRGRPSARWSVGPEGRPHCTWYTDLAISSRGESNVDHRQFAQRV